MKYTVKRRLLQEKKESFWGTPAEIAVAILAEIIAVRNGVALMQKKEGSAMPLATGVCAR